MKIDKGLSVRIYPTNTQKMWLDQQFGNVRFIWNYFLDYIEKQYKKGNKFPHKYNLYNMLKSLKAENTWLKQSEAKSLQCEIGNLYKTYKMFFRKICRHPRFKSRKKSRQSYTSDQVPSQKKCNNHILKIAKLGFIKAHFSSSINGKIKQITVMKKPTGQYYASLILECESQAFKKTGRKVGIDVGVAHLLNLSDGTKFNLKHFDKGVSHKKHFWQVRLARRRRQAVKNIRIDEHLQKAMPNHHVKPLAEYANYQKAKSMVAKYSAKMANQRKNYLQWLTTYLVRRYDVICIEDLKSHNMIKNHHLARSIAEASWRDFRDMLEYKCKWYGKTLKCVDKDFTSQVCSYCHTWCGKKRLNVRSFYCKNKKCPYHHKKLDRDTNASINILNLGLGKIKPKTLQRV